MLDVTVDPLAALDATVTLERVGAIVVDVALISSCCSVHLQALLVAIVDKELVDHDPDEDEEDTDDDRKECDDCTNVVLLVVREDCEVKREVETSAEAREDKDDVEEEPRKEKTPLLSFDAHDEEEVGEEADKGGD